ncbi:hypothetical protein [Fodinibius salsisoli]|uniref:UPF0489 family protein n=1 Tax=Fodinibius salsisoli TaxID=2820877 RepID=A0ABT3PI82_9BACT|nr:hypothetical protein [Fodinibius salsisoli]MCW9705627.1 UPF0489 family protein [Fodinibius salsisoli]
MPQIIDPENFDPPGTFRETIPHPAGHHRAIEKAIMMEHRFAFFFWMKWTRVLQSHSWLQQEAPTLVTIDWHRDLAPPTAEQKEGLDRLNSANLSEVAQYVWKKFDQTNDGHILCAAWLNLVGDIILLKNSADSMQHTFTDRNGHRHTIREFRELNQLENYLQQRKDKNIFLDVDLDYFIHGKGNIVYPDTFEPYSAQEIKAVIDYENKFFKYLLPRIDGMTIAQEPSYCGGIVNSCRIMEVVNSQLFDKNNNWRHLDSST